MSRRSEQRRKMRELEARQRQDEVLLSWMAKFPPLAPPDPAMSVNIYACDTCGRPTITRDVSKGVTPAMLMCRGDADLFDDDGMPIEIPYEVSEADKDRLTYISNDELLDAARLPENIDGALFLALAHHDPERSELIQDRFAEHATPDQLAAFTGAVLTAAAERHVRCPGTGHSTFYALPPEESTPWAIVELLAEPPWEWYRPTELDELRDLDDDMLLHIQQGGLLLRKRTGATGRAPLPEDLQDVGGTNGKLARFFKGLMGQ